MPWLIYILVPIAVSVALYAMKRDAAKKESTMNPQCFTVRQPRLAVWVGICCMLLFGGFMVLMSIFPNETAVGWVYALFAAFTLLGLFLVVYALRWGIEVDSNSLRYTPLFGSQKQVSLSQIERVVQFNQGIKVYAGGHRLFTVEYNCIGYGLLCQRLAALGLLAA